MSKSADAFRTISEVADWLDLPTHVLRFWESKFAQVKPVKRAGGRRYYRPRDMQLIGGLKTLLHDDGMTIRGAQKLLKENGVQHVINLSPPLEAGLVAEANPIESTTEEYVEPTAKNQTEIEQNMQQPEQAQTSALRPKLRLVEQDEDQFDLFSDTPSDNLWAEDDHADDDMAAPPTADARPAALPDTRADQLLHAAQRGTLSSVTLETLITRVQSAIARRA